MADLTSNFLGIRSPNPFWLASAPPTDKAYNVYRAFEAGWGGAVWKTLGEDPAPVNVCSRYSCHRNTRGDVIGFNNIELITDRPLQVNLDEIRQTKKDWPDRALLVSLMVPCKEESWQAILRQVEETGCDGVELNFGCPHGMSERGWAQRSVRCRTILKWLPAGASNTATCPLSLNSPPISPISWWLLKRLRPVVPMPSR